MTARVKALLAEIEKLTDREKIDLTTEIVRRSGHWEYPPLTDEELTLAAEEVFLRLDKEEAEHERSRSGRRLGRRSGTGR